MLPSDMSSLVHAQAVAARVNINKKWRRAGFFVSLTSPEALIARAVTNHGQKDKLSREKKCLIELFNKSSSRVHAMCECANFLLTNSMTFHSRN